MGWATVKAGDERFSLSPLRGGEGRGEGEKRGRSASFPKPLTLPSPLPNGYLFSASTLAFFPSRNFVAPFVETFVAIARADRADKGCDEGFDEGDARDEGAKHVPL